MNVVDSSGWLGCFTGGTRENLFRPVILDIELLVIPTIVIYEVCRRTLHTYGAKRAREVELSMRVGRTIALDRTLALDAAVIAQTYKLAMADSIILATARAYNATLWTQDADFNGIEGVKYIAKA